MANTLIKKDLKYLRTKLPPGSIAVVCQKTEMSRSTVEKVLYGYRSSEVVLRNVVELASLSDEERIVFTNKIKALTIINA